MGSYTSLTVGGYEILSTKSFVEPVIMTVFNEGDRRALLIRARESSPAESVPITQPHDPELWMEVEQGESKLDVAYTRSAGAVRDRLHVMGFTLSDLRRAYESARHQRLSDLDSYASDPDVFLSGTTDAERELLEELSFQRWLDNVRQVIASGISRWDLQSRPEFANRTLSPIQTYLLDTDRPLFGFDLGDERRLLRAVVEVADPAAEVVLDLSEVMLAGYYEVTAQVAEASRQDLRATFSADVPTVVLTEGRTDSEFLSASLAILLPHLTDYYSFLDFESVGVVGGAGPLVSTVKSFVAARIANRVVALFDNDTAATAAMKSLQRLALPPTVRVLQLPSLPLATAYPTIGPTGRAASDINGHAGSIELYLGEDVLTRPDGTLTPVVWKGYEQSVGRYQGELDEKPRLQEAFRAKVQVCQRIGAPRGEWSAMRLVLEALVNAFAPEDPIHVAA